ncbi:AbrB family transcriptional regulator [Nigerium massiliense]|uniref:AbrB family transcriptional regulator n=1 Tax=Nigerium massiliense TaxID=1522317 RepID=UPI00058D927F|nr:AbrB family transcriptional regulator [Nigerium massiliense]
MNQPQPNRSAARVAVAWLVVLAASAGVSALMRLLGLPSPELFGALFVSMTYAVSGLGPSLTVPGPVSALGQGLIGVSMGSLIQLATLQALGTHAAVIMAINVATLLASLLMGHLFSRLSHVSEATGAFSLIAGGASGVTAIARELGADDRITGVVQYLRVLIILVGMPIVTTVIFHPARQPGAAPGATDVPLGMSLVYVAISLAAGGLVTRLTHFPAGWLLGPLFVAGALSTWGVLGPTGVPPLLVSLAYAVVGLQVGTRFTRSSLAQVGRLLPLALAMIVLIVAVCAGFGLCLSAVTGLPRLDTYLATTPGGLYAVLATAAESGADVTFVLAVQVIRLILVLFSAPFLAAFYRRRGRVT